MQRAPILTRPVSTKILTIHCNDVIMSVMASQITSLTIIYSTVCSGANQRKYQSSVSLAFVRGIHRSPVNSPHKGPVTRKMFPFDNVIMKHIARPRRVSSVSSEPGVSSVCLAIVLCALWYINGSCYWLKLGCILKIMSKTQDGCDYFLKKKI